MIRRVLVGFALAAISATAAPVPKEAKKSEKFEGTWHVVGLNTHGQPSEQGGDSYWTITADAFLIQHNGSTVPKTENPSIRLTHDPGTKTVAFTMVNPPNRNYPGLYDITHDVLKINFNLEGQDLPKSIEPGQDRNLWTFKRVKPGEMK